jgi:predicted dehydrogenase
MKKNDKIAIIGYGSIGKRHYKNLTALGFDNVYVYDPDRSNFSGAEKILKKVTEKDLAGIKMVFICNPNNVHIRTAIMAAKAGAHLFIEKPLSHSMFGIAELESIVRKKKLVTMVGCNMRFHPCLEFIKKHIDNGKLGKIFSINLEFGYYLPYWRPNQDYRKNYAAKRNMGGGIILDDIHEFDLLFWLNDFADTSKEIVISNRASDLGIETEDQAVGVFVFKNKVVGTVIANYLSQQYRRRLTIIGEKGNLTWDFNENIVWLETKGERKKLYKADNFDFNEVYINETKYFIHCVDKKNDSGNTVGTASGLLKIILR